jgi:hypothetical protein
MKPRTGPPIVLGAVDKARANGILFNVPDSSPDVILTEHG